MTVNTSVDVSLAQCFLGSLWPEIPDGLRCLIWQLEGKRSHWCATVESAAQTAVNAPGDVYVGVALARSGLAPFERVKATSAVAIGGVWLDIDIAGGNHSKKRLPPSEGDALSLLDGLPEPTWVLHTGWGLHCWWLFREIWIFDDDADREAAAELVKRWHRLVELRAWARRWELDSVFDLSRVMRIAGTANWKSGKPCPVRVVAQSDARYNPGELVELLDEARIQATGKISNSGDEFQSVQVNYAATVTDAELELLAQADTRFWPTWNRERFDLKDLSQSGYDLAICNLAARCCWDVQRICDLLLHFRRRHSAKPVTPAYIFRTIRKALDAVQADPERPPQPPQSPPADETARLGLVMRQSRELLGLEVTRLVQYRGDDDASYKLTTSLGEVTFPDVATFFAQPLFRQRVFLELGHTFPPMKAQKWQEILGLLASIRETVEADADSAPTGALKLKLDQYLNRVHIHTSWESVRDARGLDWTAPHVEDGSIAVNTTHFITWLSVHHQERPTARKISGLLRAIGCKSPMLRGIKGKTSASFWRLPKEEFPPEDYIKA